MTSAPLSMSPPPAFLTASAVNTNSFTLSLAGTSSAFSSFPMGTKPPFSFYNLFPYLQGSLIHLLEL
jgi:hypothetical protein